MSQTAVKTNHNSTLDGDGIISRLAHRYPMLLVDRIIALERGKHIHGVKNVSIAEHFFQGHLPNRPVMPGVLIMEALAQACQLLVLSSGLESSVSGPATLYLVAIDKGRFRKPVLPGDQLILQARWLGSLKGEDKFAAHANVDGCEVASALIMIGSAPSLPRPSA